jgi:hypothetical protein
LLSCSLALSLFLSFSPRAASTSRILSLPIACTSRHLSPPCILALLLSLRLQSCVSHRTVLARYFSCSLTSMPTHSHRYTFTDEHTHTHTHMHMHKHKHTHTYLHAHTCRYTSHLAHIRIRTGAGVSWRFLSPFSSRNYHLFAKTRFPLHWPCVSSYVNIPPSLASIYYACPTTPFVHPNTLLSPFLGSPFFAHDDMLS